jgi:hypothetical protein
MSKVKGQRSKGKGLVFSNQQQKQKRWRGSAANINKVHKFVDHNFVYHDDFCVYTRIDF